MVCVYIYGESFCVGCVYIYGVYIYGESFCVGWSLRLLFVGWFIIFSWDFVEVGVKLI